MKANSIWKLTRGAQMSALRTLLHCNFGACFNPRHPIKWQDGRWADIRYVWWKSREERDADLQCARKRWECFAKISAVWFPPTWHRV